jgi:hypothetical protein
MELFRRNSKVQKCLTIKADAIDAYLCYNIAAIQKQLLGIASLIKGMSGKSTSVIGSTHCIKKAILCSGNNDVDNISEEVLNSLDGLIKISIDFVFYRPSTKIHIPVEFEVMSDMFLFIS